MNTSALTGIKSVEQVSFDEVMKKARRIVELFHPQTIIFFGSYLSNYRTQDSDIDLLIIVNEQVSSFDKSVEISLALEHDFPMDIIVKTANEIKERIEKNDSFIQDILENGKVLYERNGV